MIQFKDFFFSLKFLFLFAVDNARVIYSLLISNVHDDNDNSGIAIVCSRFLACSQRHRTNKIDYIELSTEMQPRTTNTRMNTKKKKMKVSVCIRSLLQRQRHRDEGSWMKRCCNIRSNQNSNKNWRRWLFFFFLLFLFAFSRVALFLSFRCIAENNEVKWQRIKFD